MRLVQLRRGSQPQTLSPQGVPPSAPLSLVDRRARAVRYVRISLLDRCNYRCTYCMPEGPMRYGPRADILSLEEIVRLAASFARWGVERVRLTGGEPTLRRGLLSLIERLSALRTASGAPLRVVMTTNGERLEGLAAQLRAAGLSELTVSIDSLDSERFTTLTRRGNLDRVLAGIEAAAGAGFASLKLNAVAIAGFNDDELAALSRFAWDRDITPRFIEQMPMGGGELFVPGEMMSAASVRERVATDLGVALVADDGAGVRGQGPASYWRVRSGRYAGRRLGTIGAMTENFCADCNRLRVSATGQLHGCLARDETGDLRSALRRGVAGELEEVVQRVLRTKRDAHDFGLDGSGGPQKAMVSIGG